MYTDSSESRGGEAELCSENLALVLYPYSMGTQASTLAAASGES
jgi:hypothetical protein